MIIGPECRHVQRRARLTTFASAPGGELFPGAGGGAQRGDSTFLAFNEFLAERHKTDIGLFPQRLQAGEDPGFRIQAPASSGVKTGGLPLVSTACASAPSLVQENPGDTGIAGLVQGSVPRLPNGVHVRSRVDKVLCTLARPDQMQRRIAEFRSGPGIGARLETSPHILGGGAYQELARIPVGTIHRRRWRWRFGRGGSLRLAGRYCQKGEE